MDFHSIFSNLTGLYFFMLGSITFIRFLMGNPNTPYNKILKVSQELDAHIVEYYEKKVFKKAI